MSSAQDLPPGAAEAPVRARRAALAVVPDAEPTASTAEVVWDPAELEAVIARATPRLVRFAQRRLGNHHEAEEVAQDALMRTYQHRHTLATEDDVMAWATFAANRLVIDRLRVRGRSIAMSEIPEGRRVARDTADIAEARAEARIALDALDSLPARQAAVLWAREVEGSSYEDISVRFGLSEPTVRSLLHRARKALRREYAVRGGTLFSGAAILGPWLNPLHNVRRLRTVASALIGTTALGFAGIAAISVTTVSPDNIRVTPQTTRSVAVTTAATQKAITTHAHVKAAQPRVTPTVTTHSAAPADIQPALHMKACSTAGRGINCDTTPTSHAVWVGTSAHRIYIGDNALSCSVLKKVPALVPALSSITGCLGE